MELCVCFTQLWCNLNGSGRSNNIPFPTSFQNSISVLFYSLLLLHAWTSASVSCILLHSTCITASWQNRRAVDEQGRRVHLGELSRLGSSTVRAKGQMFFSLSFGHSLSPLSCSKSKLILLHSNAAPAAPPNWVSLIGYSTCKTL